MKNKWKSIAREFFKPWRNSEESPGANTAPMQINIDARLQRLVPLGGVLSVMFGRIGAACSNMNPRCVCRSNKLITLACLFTMTNAVADALPTPEQSSQSGALSPRIIGGIGINIEQYPATAALLYTSRVELDGNLSLAQFCAGSVIAARWILTAAHCVSDLQGNQLAPESIQVLTGSSDLNEPVNQPIQVVRILIHSDYKVVETGKDIALLELEIDAQVQPVALAAAPALQNEKAFIVGWGGLTIPGEGVDQVFPTILQGTFVNITPGQNCAQRFPIYSPYSSYMHETMICAGVNEGGHDTCQGDSGGPLYRINPEDNSVLSVAGITSWGISCGLAESPGVYTHVASYIDWIENTLNIAGAVQVR